MAKKINSKDIFEGNIFKTTKEGAEELNTQLKSLISGFADLGKTIKSDLPKGRIESFEDLDKAAKDIGKVNQAFEGFTKAQKEQAKLQEKLAELKTEDAKQNEVTRLQIQEQRKANKQLAKEQKGLIGSYQKLAKRLNDNRKRLKNLAAEGKTNTKEFRKLKKEVSSLDAELKDIDATAGQFQRNVGNYPETLKDAADSLKNFAAGAIAAKLSLEGLNEVVTSNEESAGKFEEVVGLLKGGFSEVTSSLGGFIASLVDGESITEAYSNNIEGVVDRTQKAAEAGKVAAKETREFAKTIRPLNEELTVLNAKIEEQNQLAGDTTKSFDEQEKAAKKAQKLTIERALILEAIATKQLEIIDKQIESAGKNANVQELLNERSEKLIELTEAQNELNLATIENEKILREVRRDRFERELDFAIDAFDAQKTINERQIADDRKTIEERAAIFNETVRLAESSFNSQKELFATFVSDKIDFDALVKETDEAAIRRTLRRLDLDDVELGRALEVIKERKIALQDLDDAEREIDDAQTERRDRRLAAEQGLEEEQFRGAIENQERLNALNEENNQIQIDGIEELFRLRRELLIDQAEFEQSSSEATAEEKIVIEQRLINDLAALEQDRLTEVESVNKKIEEADAKSAEERLEIANKLIELTGDAFDEAFDEREKALDDEISRREEKVSLQQSRAEKGLENQLAFEKQQLAQAERERAELAEKRAKQEEAQALAQAFLNAFASRSKDDPDTAAAKALSDVIIAKALSETVAGAFAEGVEDFQGEGTNTSDSNLIRFSHGESVVTAKGTRENKGLVTAMNNGDVGGWFANNMVLTPLSKDKNYDTFGLLAEKIDSIEKTIKNRPTTSTNLDNMGNVLQSTYRNGVKNTVKYLNARPRI